MEFQEEESTNAIFEEIIVETIPLNDEQYPATYLRNPTNSKWILHRVKTMKTKNKNILKPVREIAYIVIEKSQHLTSSTHLHGEIIKRELVQMEE